MFDKSRLIGLTIGVLFIFFSFIIYPWVLLIFPFVPPLRLSAEFSMDGAFANIALTFLWAGFLAESTSILPFGYYKSPNNEYRFGQIKEMVMIKISVVIISDILIFHLLYKYWDSMIIIYGNSSPNWTSFISAISITTTLIWSYNLIKKLIKNFNDYIEINTNYIEWFDLQADIKTENGNYFLKSPKEKGSKIKINLDEIIHVIPIIAKDRNGDHKFIKFDFNLINDAKATLDLDEINQIPNGEEINKVIITFLDDKFLEATEVKK